MAITSGLVRIILRYQWLGQQCENVGYYAPNGAAWLTATAAAGAEAWWNNIKDRWLALYPGDPTTLTTSVLFEELGGSESFGEYGIPPAEQQGTRVEPLVGSFMPAYVAVGVRLTVGTRTTRPGQKRIPFATEFDNDGGAVGGDFLALVEAAAEIWSTILVLGAPVALGALTPQVVHFPTIPDPVQRQQDIIGFVVNPLFTSQVSRRPGHGS